MRNNMNLQLAQSMVEGRPDMASHSYNTGGQMRPDMGAIKNGQPSLPTSHLSMLYVNRGNNAVNKEVKLPAYERPERTTVSVGMNGSNPHPMGMTPMGNNPAHPAAQLASYLFANRLSDPSNFYRGG